jgi:hypothetical protein
VHMYALMGDKLEILNLNMCALFCHTVCDNK